MAKHERFVAIESWILYIMIHAPGEWRCWHKDGPYPLRLWVSTLVGARHKQVEVSFPAPSVLVVVGNPMVSIYCMSGAINLFYPFTNLLLILSLCINHLPGDFICHNHCRHRYRRERYVQRSRARVTARAFPHAGTKVSHGIHRT